MKIKLSNFRSHYDSEFIFEEGRLTLISGASGAGKTTILEAIRWCLYGSIRKISSFGKKKCEVQIQDKNISIKRLTSPLRLYVTYGEDYEDSEAQSIIDNVYGKEDTFMLSSYLSQMSRNIILTGSREEKLSIIRSMSLDEDMIINMKEKIAKKIEDINDELDDKNFEYRKNKQKFKEFKKKHELKDIPGDTMDNHTYREIKKLIEIKEKQIIINEENKRKLDKFKDEISKIKYIELDDDMKKISMMSITDARNKELKEKLEKQLIPDEYGEIPNDLETLEVKIMNKMKLEKLDISDIEDEDKLKVMLDLSKRKESYKDINDRKQELIKLIENTKTSSKCPNCDSMISFNPSTQEFEKYNNTKKTIGRIKNIPKFDPTWYDELKKIDEILSYDLKESQYYRNAIHRIKEYKKLKNHTTDAQYTPDDIQRFKDIRKIKENNQKINDMIKHLNFEVIDASSEDIERVKKIISDNEEYKRLMSLCSTLESEILEVNNDEIKEMKKKLKDHEVQTKYKNILDTYKNSKILYDELNKKVELYKRLEAIIKKAELASLNNFLEHINSTLAKILDEIFDAPITINFSMIKKLKNGKEKNDISLNITYNGNEYDSIKQLSGGECDRLSFAITLCFNKVLNSRLLLLDESINSLDAEMRQRILKILNENKAPITICINHEVIKGLFDDIIELE